jgi:hypothetical protein
MPNYGKYAQSLSKSRLSRKALSNIIHGIEEAKHGGITRGALTRMRALKAEFPKGYQSLKDAASATIKGSATIMGDATMKRALNDLRKHYMKSGVPAFSAKARSLTDASRLKSLLKMGTGIAPAAAIAAGSSSKRQGFKYGGMAGCCPTCGRK